MFRIDDPTAAGALPTPEAAGTPGYFTEGNPGVTSPTLVRASFLNMLQEEFIAVCVAAGITPSKTTYNQLLTALRSAGVFQTPSPGDNTTKVATTAFLAAAFTAKFKGTLGANGSASFEVDDAGTKKTLIIQWGITANVPSGGSVVVTFPIAFPTGPLVAVATIFTSGLVTSASYGTNVGSGSTATTMSVFGFTGNATSQPAHWIAIGR